MGELALAFLGLVYLALPWVAFAIAIRASRRAEELEARLRRLEAPRPVSRPIGTPEPAVASPPSGRIEEEPAPPPAPRAPPLPPPEPRRVAPEPAPRRAAFEELIGLRGFVWLGGVALALGGAYLVKYSIERGLVGPGLRCILGALLGLLLLGAGRAMRGRSTRISQALSGAAVVDLYATTLAATNLYGFLGARTGFLLLAALTACCILLALRQGPPIAALGLVGGFLAPALIGGAEPEPGRLFVYLALLEAGLLLLARGRGWWGLGAVSLLGGFVWAALWLRWGHAPDHRGWIAGFLFLTAILALLAGRTAGGGSAHPAARTVGTAAAGISLLLVSSLAWSAGLTNLDWGLVGMASAGSLLLARLDPRARPLAGVAAVLSGALFHSWGSALFPPEPRFFATLGAFLALFLGPGLAFARGGGGAAPFWASIAAGSALLFFFAGYRATRGVDPLLPWWAAALSLALLLALGALPHLRRRNGGSGALAVLLSGATLFTAVAVPLALEGPWEPVAWAALVPILCLLDRKLALPVLRGCAAACALPALLRLLLDPGLWSRGPGPLPILDLFLVAYGSAFAAFALAVRETRARAPALSGWLEIALWLLVPVYLAWEVRHLYHLGGIREPRLGLAESASYGIAFLSAGFVVRWSGFGRFSGAASRFLQYAGLLLVAILPGLLRNPLLSGARVHGGFLANTLLLAYGAPAALLAALAQERGSRHRAVFAVAALCLVFLHANLEVRRLFRGADLTGRGPPGHAELYGYSVAWVLLGVAFLAAGVRFRSALLRYASAAVMALAAGKVFLFDTSHLAGLYRVFSFLGLGATLLALAYVYQRVVFRRE